MLNIIYKIKIKLFLFIILSSSRTNPSTTNQSSNLHTIVNTNQLADCQNQLMPRNQQDEQLQKIHQQHLQQQQQTSSLKTAAVPSSKSPPKSPQISFVTQNTKTEKITM